MCLSITLVSLVLLPSTLISCVLGTTNFSRSSKRGLIYIPSSDTSDDSIWTGPGSDLTWYYNYGSVPSSAYNKLPSSSFQFIPMLFTAPTQSSDNSFINGVKSLISGGANISHVLSYNEPDGSTSTGGSNVAPELAAAAWVTQLEPLRKLGVKVGAPAVTGSTSGLTWLENFFKACNGGCNADFMPMHWYGNFEGLASHMGQRRAAYPNMTLWVTEYALPHSSLNDSQYFFNQSAEYFDRLDYVTRYSYFGSFRSIRSNVGANAAMLEKDGKLTDIGSWYLGGAATGFVPQSGASKAPENVVLGTAVAAIVAIYMSL